MEKNPQGSEESWRVNFWQTGKLGEKEIIHEESGNKRFKIFGWQVLLSKVDRVPARKFSSEIIHWLF